MAKETHKVKAESLEVDREYKPTVYLDLSKDQLDMLDVGNKVTVNLTGKVKGLSSNEHGKDKRYSLDLELDEVKINPEENEFTKLSEDD